MGKEPNLKAESTLEEIIMWLRTSRCRAWVENVFQKPEKHFDYVDEILEADDWLPGQWKPTRSQYVVLVVLLERSMEGKSEEEIDAVNRVLIDLFKLPEILWPHVMVNIEEGTLRLHDIEVSESTVDPINRVMNLVPKRKGKADAGQSDSAGR